MFVLLNNNRYPAIDFNSDFEKFRFDNVYKTLTDFRQRFYDLDHLMSNTMVDPLTSHELYPQFAFDVSKQSKRLKQGVVDITVEIAFGANEVANTIDFALMISDRELRFKSYGKKMNVVH